MEILSGKYRMSLFTWQGIIAKCDDLDMDIQILGHLHLWTVIKVHD